MVGRDGFEPPNSNEKGFTVPRSWPLCYLPNLMASPLGFEPRTLALEEPCSIQLS